MSGAFTPGPWSLDENDVRDEAQTVLSDWTGCPVAEAFLGARGGECEANAHLIAASPALYEALEWLLRASVTGGLSNAQLGAVEAKARAALALARGEQPESGA